MNSKLLGCSAVLLTSISLTAVAYDHDAHAVGHVMTTPSIASNSEAQYVHPRSHAVVVARPGQRELLWVDVVAGGPMPLGMMRGGYQPERPHEMYVCRGYFRNGVHPGKLQAGSCHIGWGGREILLSHFQVLVPQEVHLTWLPASDGAIPANAIPGGHELGGPLYICQAKYRGGMHPGKVVGEHCNFAWGGREILQSRYWVLSE